MSSLVPVHAVGVLHYEVPHPEHPGAGPGLVAELDLHLVPVLGQVPVGTKLGPGQVGDDLLVGGAQGIVPFFTVLDPEHLVPEILPPPALLPDLGRRQGRQKKLLGPGPVHLLPDYLHHLQEHPPPQGQIFVDPGGQLADHSGSQHQLMALHLGLGLVLLDGGYESFTPAQRSPHLLSLTVDGLLL